MEKNFATNTVGTHILTRGLIRLIEKSSDPRVITVSSGGMLTQKLNLGDLQSEKMSPFDGTMVYAQNKRQQVVMTRKYAQTHQNIFFASMHPGICYIRTVQYDQEPSKYRWYNCVLGCLR